MPARACCWVLYNGHCFPFDLTDLRAIEDGNKWFEQLSSKLDGELFEDCSPQEDAGAREASLTAYET